MKVIGRILAAFVVAACMAGGYALMQAGTKPPATVAAATPAQQVAHDEAADLIAACGRPVTDRSEKKASYYSVGEEHRTLHYKQVDFLFARDAKYPIWGFASAFLTHGDDSLDKDEVAAKMPCIRPVQFANDDLFDLK